MGRSINVWKTVEIEAAKGALPRKQVGGVRTGRPFYFPLNCVDLNFVVVN